jgi:microcin C transport system permease protein
MQWAPGGPLENLLMKAKSANNSLTSPLGADSLEFKASKGREKKEDLESQLKKLYGFDQSVGTRLLCTLKRCLTFDFGESYFKAQPVSELILNRLPISMILGMMSLLIIYAISIPLGLYKAQKNHSLFDNLSTVLMMTTYAIPSFLMALTLILLFAGGSFWSFFPLKGFSSNPSTPLLSTAAQDMGQMIKSLWIKTTDFLWHLTLPILSEVLGGFASLTFFVKNAFLKELNEPYLLTLRSLGFSESRCLWRYAFKNALFLMIGQFPLRVMTVVLGGSFLIENLFSLEGLGHLSVEALENRDYPVIFASLYLYTLIAMVMQLISDLLYAFLDPRIQLATDRESSSQ